MNRRSFLSSIIAAPVVITTPGLLMPIRRWIAPNPLGYKPIRGEIRDCYTFANDAAENRSVIMQICTGKEWVPVNSPQGVDTLISFGWSHENIKHAFPKWEI